MSKKKDLMEWLAQEVLENHSAETFSRNGESTDFDSGVFKGREEMAKEIFEIINKGCVFKKTPEGLKPCTQ